MKIKVIKTSVEWQEKGKSKWQKLNVVFHNEATGKVDGRNILSFTNKDVFNALATASKDDVFELTEVQNAKGYPEVVKVEKLDSGGFGPVAVPASAPDNGTKAVAAPRSNFETPEERAKRQEYIIRQSSLGHAISVLTVGATVPPNLSDVLGLASEFVNFVFDKPDPMNAIAQMDNDIPEAA